MMPFKPAWNSLSQHAMPQWLRDAKFGIYTTWGIFSVSAYAGIDHWQRNPNVTRYGHDMYEKNHPVYRRQPVGGALPDEKYLKDWHDQIIEVINGYDPDLIWFDFCFGRIPARYRKHFPCQQLHPADILSIRMLGDDGRDLEWSITEDGLNIEVPDKVPSNIAVSIKITTKTAI